jgi:hypothetical protein
MSAFGAIPKSGTNSNFQKSKTVIKEPISRILRIRIIDLFSILTRLPKGLSKKNQLLSA